MRCVCVFLFLTLFFAPFGVMATDCPAGNFCIAGETNAGITSNPEQVVTTVEYAADYLVQKPSTLREGQVLTFTSNSDPYAQPAAQYVKLPVASGDPNATSNAATPSGFASIWVQ